MKQIKINTVYSDKVINDLVDSIKSYIKGGRIRHYKMTGRIENRDYYTDFSSLTLYKNDKNQEVWELDLKIYETDVYFTCDNLSEVLVIVKCFKNIS